MYSATFIDIMIDIIYLQLFRNTTNHPISSKSHPSATENKIYRLKREGVYKSKIEKVPMVFKVKGRVKTCQIRRIWSQTLEHKQVSNRGTEQGVRKGKRALLACHTRCKCSMESNHNSMKVKFGIKVITNGNIIYF